MKFVKYNASPYEIKKGMEKSREKILEFLEEISVQAKEKKDLFNIALVSSNYNENIAEIVSESLWEIGLDGIIEIEAGTRGHNELLVYFSFLKKNSNQIIISKFTEGVSLNRGYASSEFLVKQDNKSEKN